MIESMIFAKERAEVICKQLKNGIYQNKLELTAWKKKHGNFLRPQDAEQAPAPWEDFDSRAMFWHGPDAHDWFYTELELPESLAGRPVWLLLNTQIDEWDDAKNPQFLLFVNGNPVQGMDMNHREALVLASARAGEKLRIDLQAYTGTLHADFRLFGTLANADEQTRGLYYDLQVPLWSLSRMEKDDKTRLDIETALNSAVNLIDLRRPGSEEYAASVERARSFLAGELYGKLGGCRDVIATCIGHTHIDVAWWWTVEQTREKVARSFATVLQLMEEYPDYKFMSSQPQLYAFLKARYPELYEKVKQRVREGRWEVEGGMWLEADCNLTSGESLVRQFLFGKRFFKEEFGVDNRILWLPDVFGYSACLPQLMKKSGIDYFMTTKLSWNQFNKIPYDTLRWRGIDGSEVLAHLITTLGVGQEVNNFFTTYNGLLHPDAIMGGWQRYQNKEINNDILVAFGYGDGGGGPTREMLETAERMQKGIRGVPAVRQAFAREYFEQLEERVGENRRLPTWVGELYFEYHRGTYTSMARNKRANRKSEFLLMDVELLSVMAQSFGCDYPGDALQKLWETVLLNQFHDILPGSSIAEVYEVTRAEYEQVAREGRELLTKRLGLLAGEGEALVVFNTLGFERGDVVSLGQCDCAALADETGASYPVQQTEGGAVAYLRGLPSKGYRSFRPCEGEAQAESPFRIETRAIETPFYRAAFDEAGVFTSLFDKENGREIFRAGQRGNLMRVYEDKPIYYDNWDIDIYYDEKFWDVEDVQRMEWVEQGPVRATLRVERLFSGSRIWQDIHFYADTRRIDFESYVDWHECQHLLKVHFPFELNTDEATFDIQFGNVKRKTHRNTSWDWARFESCGQKWADLSEGGYGVSLLNDCKYGHSVKDADLALTLIKSGNEPNPHTDQEEHWFTYSLYPHAGGWREAGTAREAYCLNQPAYAVKGKEGLCYSLLGLQCGGGHVMAETVKRAEDNQGIVVRLYEYHNARGRCKLELGFTADKAWECDLLENNQKPLSCTGREVEFEIAPYEIKTIRLLPAGRDAVKQHSTEKELY